MIPTRVERAVATRVVEKMDAETSGGGLSDPKLVRVLSEESRALLVHGEARGRIVARQRRADHQQDVRDHRKDKRDDARRPVSAKNGLYAQKWVDLRYQLEKYPKKRCSKKVLSLSALMLSVYSTDCGESRRALHGVASTAFRPYCGQGDP